MNFNNQAWAFDPNTNELIGKLVLHLNTVRKQQKRKRLYRNKMTDVAA